MSMGRAAGCAFLLFASAALAQQYPILPVAGSPRNIEHLLEDRQGRLWVSTLDDLLCFDGERFFSLHDLGFPHETPTLAEDDDGAIIAATPSGVYRFDRGHLSRLTREIGASSVIALAPGLLEAVGDRNLHAPHYLIRRAGGEWRTENIGEEASGVATKDHSGNLLRKCDGGWCELPASMARSGTADQRRGTFHAAATDFQRIWRDRVGCLWFRSTEAARYQCAGDPEPVLLPSTVAGRNVWADVQECEDGSIIFANADSLAIGRPGSFQVLTPSQGLPLDTISSALRTRDGSIWMGTIGGLYRFPHPFRMTFWTSRNGQIRSFARSDDRIFAGTSSGVAQLVHGDWEILPSTRDFGTISSLVADSDGTLWAVVNREAVLHLGRDGSLLTRTPPPHGDLAEQLIRTSAGEIWAAASAVSRVRQHAGQLELVPEPMPAASFANGSLATDREGKLWSCAPGSLAYLEGADWRIVSRDAARVWCRSMAFAENGTIWVGDSIELKSVHPSADGKAKVVTYTSKEIGGATSFVLKSDSRGWIWRGSQDGMYVAQESDAERGAWVHLNENDGLRELDINSGSLFPDGDGSMWWAANSSIVHFVPPRDLASPAGIPAVFLSSLSADGGRPQFVEFHPTQRGRTRIQAHLGTLEFAHRNEISVRYRLLPGAPNWRETSARDLDLGTLWWGAYTLELQSRYSQRNWSATQKYAITLAAPWWFPWPGLLALAALGGGAAVGERKRRERQQARARGQLPDLSSWRMAVLRPEAGLAGTVLDGRFEIGELLARGGFATVLRGRDLETGKPCAIKIFRPELIDESWMKHRFQQEVAALQLIRRRSVVSIYGHGQAPGGAPYLAMEFIEGDTLRLYLNSGPVASRRTASILRQTADALTQIHGLGIYHRDLKPENLMLRAGTPEGEELVLIDFSIAIVKEPDQTMHGLSRAAGTLYYMAPEQAIGFANSASDVYSLAKVTIEMMTGRRLTDLFPSANLDLPEKVREFLRAQPNRLSEESVEQLAAALEFDPARRPQEAAPFALPIVRDLMAAPGDRATSLAPSPNGDEPDELSSR